MTKTAVAILRQEERTERRKDQILAAARTCVRKHGIHAASMSRIAAEAGMSVGHIYQYFENKEALMIALCEADFQDFMLHMTQLDEHPGLSVDLVAQTFLSKVPLLTDPDNSGIALEVLAEAGRNPKVAELVASVDRQFRDEIRKIIRPVLQDMPEREVEVLVEMLLFLTRGLVLHAGMHRDEDIEMVLAGFELTLRSLLSSAHAAPRAAAEANAET